MLEPFGDARIGGECAEPVEWQELAGLDHDDWLGVESNDKLAVNIGKQKLLQMRGF